MNAAQTPSAHFSAQALQILNTIEGAALAELARRALEPSTPYDTAPQAFSDWIHEQFGALLPECVTDEQLAQLWAAAERHADGVLWVGQLGLSQAEILGGN